MVRVQQGLQMALFLSLRSPFSVHAHSCCFSLFLEGYQSLDQGPHIEAALQHNHILKDLCSSCNYICEVCQYQGPASLSDCSLICIDRCTPVLRQTLGCLWF